jgi:hypothetical protein
VKAQKTLTLPAVSPEHAYLPPSGASRWSRCTASVGFIERNAEILPRESTVYADEGTEAHALAKKILNGEARLVQSDKADMIVNVRAYVEFVREQVQPGDRIFVERRTPLFYLQQQHGTIDNALVNLLKRIAVNDYKHGQGVSVYAEENEQLAIYAESLIQEIELIEDVSDDLPVHLNIFQPRDRNDPEPVRTWPILRKDLRKFVAPIEATAKLILADPHSPDLKFVPGEKQCRFCPAKGICKAYGTQGLSVVSDEPVDVVLAKPEMITLPSPDALTRSQRMKVVAMRPTLEKWLEAVEDQEVHDLMNGAEPLDFKLVEGKSNRKWVDEKAAFQFFADRFEVNDIAPRTILSVAQMEKYVKKQVKPGAKGADPIDFSALVTRPEGKPSLVSIEDKRPALEFRPGAGLENLVDNDVI